MIEPKNQQSKKPESPGLVKVVFDYPFHLGVPSIFIPVALDNQDQIALIRITSHEGVQTLDKSKLLRESVVDGKKEVILQDIPEATGKKNTEVVAGGEHEAPVFHYVVGEYGRAEYPWYYVTVEVVFPVSDVNSAWSNPINSEFVTKAVSNFFNRFLLSYRHVSGEIYNKYLSIENSFALNTTVYISAFTEEEKEQPTIKILNAKDIEKKVFKPFPMRGAQTEDDDIPLVSTSISSPLMMNAKKKEVPKEKMLALIKTSVNLDRVTIFNEVFLSAMERMSMDKDYRMAIIEFDTALEMTVMHYLFIFLIKAGKTPQQIADLFDEDLADSQKLHKERKGFLSTHSRIDRLEEFFNEARQKKGLERVKLSSNEEYKNWKNLVEKKRNLSVHMWQHFGKEDAEKAFHASQTFIRYIQKIGDAIVLEKIDPPSAQETKTEI